MLHIKDIATLYHIFLAFLITTSVGELLRGYLDNGEVMNDEGLLSWAFNGTPMVFTFWMFLFCWSMLVIPLVQKINDGTLKRQ
jgi:hypothetical protein